MPEQDLPWEEATLPDPDDTKPEGTTEAELDAFDQAARQRFEAELKARDADIKPGTAEAQEAIKEAIRQGK